MKKKKRTNSGATPEIPTDRIITRKCRCLICGEETGTSIDVRESDGLGEGDVRDGLCSDCEGHRQQGCCLVYTETDGMILEKSWASKLKPELRDRFIGNVMRISDDDMQRIKDALRKGLQNN